PTREAVTRSFGSWSNALLAAGCEPPGLFRRWSDREIVSALRAWARNHQRSPASSDWAHATRDHPEASTVRRHYGSFEAAVRAASLPPPPRSWRRRPWSDAEIIHALRAWADEHGRPPTMLDWMR